MKKNSFISFFILILLADLLVVLSNDASVIRYISKPAIVLSLLLYLVFHKRANRYLKKYLGAGLLFSLLGDILLLFTESGNLFFIGGLLAFLIAHLLYIKTFYIKEAMRSKKMIIYTCILLVYACAIFYLIYPGLHELLPYVIIYMAVLLFMVLTASVRKPYVNSSSFILVLLGALLFMISDSILALNKFMEPINYAGILIMSTYGMAQLLLVLGGIAQEDPE